MSAIFQPNAEVESENASPGDAAPVPMHHQAQIPRHPHGKSDRFMKGSARHAT